MTVFGDFEPEDAYDATDPPSVTLRNLARRAADIAGELAARGDRSSDRIAARVDLLAEHARQLRDRLER